MIRQQTARAVGAIALAAGGVLVGANISTTNVAQGEVSGTPEPPAFQAGDQLALPILRDISVTLHQTDARIARLEAVAQKLQTGRTRTSLPTPPADETEVSQ
ncbi:MAG TPA: hypothetical protein VH107_08495 [Lacipirellulaceae bacterium]|jgi:hypothetical protein|nr:hypothetical protein [Lacipirellulaceae bacterium]